VSDYLENLKEGGVPAMNLQRVLESDEVPEFMKAITRRILENKAGHYSVGEWLQKASWIDIDCLDRLCRVIEEGGGPEVPSEDVESLLGAMAVLTTKLFAIGEGLSSMTNNEDGVLTRLGLLQSYIAAERLKRSGLPVKVYYDAMSLDEDAFGDESVIIEMFPELKNGEES